MKKYENDLLLLRGVSPENGTWVDLEETILWSLRKNLVHRRNGKPLEYYFLTDEPLVGARIVDGNLSPEEELLLWYRKEELSESESSTFLRYLGRERRIIAFSPKVTSAYGLFPQEVALTGEGNEYHKLKKENPRERYQEAFLQMTHLDTPLIIGDVDEEVFYSMWQGERELISLKRNHHALLFKYARVYEYQMVEKERKKKGKKEKRKKFLNQLGSFYRRSFPNIGRFLLVEENVPDHLLLRELTYEYQFLKENSALWEPAITLFLPGRFEYLGSEINEDRTLREKLKVISLPVINSITYEYLKDGIDKKLTKDDFLKPGLLRRVRTWREL
ncbi:MAG: hypothetical protein Q4Q07_02585 [Tissierellia bacterium]|nr:hypothetical protein [Tissierellia bacterium]